MAVSRDAKRFEACNYKVSFSTSNFSLKHIVPEYINLIFITFKNDVRRNFISKQHVHIKSFFSLLSLQLMFALRVVMW